MQDQLMQAVLLSHAAATWFMVGLIWFVQVVHYPLMGAVPAEGFREYERRHQRLTTWVVGPVMGVEALAATLLAIVPPSSGVFDALRWLGVGLLAIIWLSTIVAQMPLHAALSRGFDPAMWRRLVLSNWIRTAAWSARGILASLMLS
ncbi:MAG: hypothetical protein ACKVW3_07830 [Phycisphaerales bacterium]